MRRRGTVAAAGLFFVTLALVSPPTPAQTAVAFSGIAEGRLVAANFTLVPGIVFPQLIDGGSSVAQAELSSLGDSKAFASDPYPSESLVLLPGLVAGLTAGATSGVVPDYPLIASSSHPSVPEQRVELGSIVLDAVSRADRSSSGAGNGVNEATATVVRDSTAGVITARAETSAGTIHLSGLLSLDGIRSTAQARKAPDGDIELSSSFDIGALVVAGQRLSLSELLALGPQQIDLGATAAGLLLDQLAAEGTTVDILPAEEAADSVKSAGLRIRMITPAPDLPPLPPLPDTGLGSVPALAAVLALPGGLSGLEHVVTEVVIGQSVARIDSRALPGRPPLAGPVGGSTATPVDLPDLGSPVAVPSVPAAPAPRPSAPEAPTVPASSLAIADVSSTPFYAVLLLAALACVGTFILIGKLGVREP